MADTLQGKLQQLARAADIQCLRNIGHGIEKESLRVDARGHIAQSQHPKGAGAPLTHEYITTDFSEALVEFITPVHHKPEDSLGFLTDLHRYFYSKLENDELLWTSSMPCIIDEDEGIPLAQYGCSNIGKLKTLYRSGLSHRYGRAMQTIAGIHYNFSLPDEFWQLYHRQLGSNLSLQDFKTEQYFHLIRNFHRYSWLLIYLFGASPAVCKSFLRKHKNHGLDEFDDHSYAMLHGTSLRMGDLGYTSEAQSGLYVSYNNLDEYIEALSKAVSTPYPPYEKFMRNEQGELQQLNSNILQIENEFYGTIRPKRPSPSGKRPIQILRAEGVEYVEVRCLDLNPFLPLGIDERQIHFLNAFLVYCLLHDSPLSDRQDYEENTGNLKTVVRRGREPGLTLQQYGRARSLQDWAQEVLTESKLVAGLLDSITGQQTHSAAVADQLAKVLDPALTPSARVLESMRSKGQAYFEFAMERSEESSRFFNSRQLDPELFSFLEAASAESETMKTMIEEQDIMSFEDFVALANKI